MLQRRYEFILFPNYFITVVYYYRTHPILFFYFFSIPTFLHFFNFFITGFFCFYVEFTISYQIQCYICTNNVTMYNGSKITLILPCLLAPFLYKESIWSKLQHTMLNCIHAYHASNNLNGVKPQSHALSQPWIHP